VTTVADLANYAAQFWAIDLEPELEPSIRIPCLSSAHAGRPTIAMALLLDDHARR
jgi:hypothetical protein